MSTHQLWQSTTPEQKSTTIDLWRLRGICGGHILGGVAVREGILLILDKLLFFQSGIGYHII